MSGAKKFSKGAPTRRSDKPPKVRTGARPRRTEAAVAVKVTRASAPSSGLAPGMQAVNTYLAVANVSATVEFLERAFGFSRGVALSDAEGRLRYAEMRHGESSVMLVPRDDAASATGGVPALYTYVDDVDRAAAQARDAGAGVGDPEDRPWGDRIATVTDPDGYRWVLATFKKLAPFS